MEQTKIADDPTVSLAHRGDYLIGGADNLEVDVQRIRFENALASCEKDGFGQEYRTITESIAVLEPKKREIIENSFLDLVEKTIATPEDDAGKSFSKKVVRQKILVHLAKGFRYGEQVMDKFSDPMSEAAEYISPASKESFTQDIEQTKAEFRAAFIHTFSRSIPVFAAHLFAEGPDLTENIFENSERYRRTIGFDKTEGIYEAMRALEITTMALESIALSGKAVEVIEMNPGDVDTPPAHTYVLEQPPKSKAARTSVYIRARNGARRYFGEYGKKDVEASVSYMVDLRDHDPRRNSQTGLKSKLARQNFHRRSDKFVTNAPGLTGNRRDKKQDHAFLNAAFAEETLSEVCIRFDFEKRGMSLDMGSILSDSVGFSYIVGNLFAIGDVIISKQLGRESSYNHNTRQIDQVRWMEKSEHLRGNTFAFMAQAMGWSLLRDTHPRLIKLHQRYPKTSESPEQAADA